MPGLKKDVSESIIRKFASRYPGAADKDEVRQLGAIGRWEAIMMHDPARGPLEHCINSKVHHRIRNGMRDWLQLRKTNKPKTLSYYSTVTDMIEAT